MIGLFKTFWHRNPNVLIFLLSLPVLLIEAKTENDFDIFIQAARDWSNGLNPYTQLYHEWYHYFYDITFLTLLSWFQHLPNDWIKLGWLTVQVILLIQIWKMVLGHVGTSAASSSTFRWLGLALVIFNIRLIRDNIHLGQMTILLLFLSIKGLELIFNRRNAFGGALLAWGIVVKILPIVVLPYLIYRNRWKGAAWTMVFCVFFVALPYLYQNTTQYSELLKSRWALLNPSNTEHILDTSERSFHSMTTLISVLFHAHCDDTHILPLRRHIWDCDVQTVKWISLISRLVLVASFLLVLRSPPFTEGRRELYFQEWAYLLMLIPLIFPHQQHYAFLMMMPGLACLLAPYFTGVAIWKWNTLRVWLLVLIFIAMNIHFLLGVWSSYYNHFKILTYGGLVALILLLQQMHPRDASHQEENI